MERKECECQICADFHQELIDAFVSQTFDKMMDLAFCICDYGIEEYSCSLCYGEDMLEKFDQEFPHNSKE
jgi:hypothetical protein